VGCNYCDYFLNSAVFDRELGRSGDRLVDFDINRCLGYLLSDLVLGDSGAIALGSICLGRTNHTIGSLIHLGAIALLQYLPTWQFLWTGIVTAGNLFLLAETQWNMQPNHTQLLSVEQKEFNQRQQQLRDLET
jgi:hypothetical protein